MKYRLLLLLVILGFTWSAKAQIIVVEDLQCSGQSDAILMADTNGWGTGPYTYLWSTGATTQVINNLPAGYYSVTITDNSLPAMVMTEDINLADPGPVAQPFIVHNNCYGESTGSITLWLNGGIPPYLFSWTGPNGFVSTNQNIINLESGVYNYFLVDGNGCFVLGDAIVLPLTPIQGYLTSENISCFGGDNGSSAAVFSGGSGALTYAWSSGESSPLIQDLTAGSYILTVTDENGCTYLDTAVIVEPPLLTLASVGQTNVTCPGFNDGTISQTAAGGTGPLSFSWTLDGNIFPALSEDISNLYAGVYVCTVTDSNGCTQSLSSTVTQMAPTTFTETVIGLSCTNTVNGYWGITPGGPDTPYVAVFSNGVTISTDSTAILYADSLLAGTYQCVITGNSGCSNSFSITIDPAPIITAAPAVTANNCFGDTIGAISLVVSGAVAPISYTWSGPSGFSATQNSITGLASGYYSYTVTDIDGCQTVGQAAVNPLMPVQGYIGKNDGGCSGANAGTAFAIFSGGNGSLSYLWSTGSTLPQIDSLGAGVYSVTVTDANGCQVTDSVNIYEYPPIVVTLDSLINLACPQDNTGAIYQTVTGGYGSLIFQWTHDGDLYPVGSADIINLAAGVYAYTATDSVGCWVSGSYTITSPFPTVFNDSVNHVSCYGGTDGYWSIEPIGTATPYVAVFSTGDTISTGTVPVPAITGLGAGTYQCWITANNGCVSFFETTITQPPQISIDVVDITPVTCNGSASGSIYLNFVQGGVPPYSFLWDSVATGDSLINLTAGIYNVIVADSMGCYILDSFEITEPYEQMKFFPTITDASCLEGEDGEIVLYRENVFWSPLNNILIIRDSLGNILDTVSLDEPITGLAPGMYVGTLINNVACVIIDTMYVDRNPDHCILIPNMVTANGDGFNDVFEVVGACDYDEFMLVIYTDMGKEVFNSQDCAFSWDPRTDGVNISSSVYYYYIKVTETGKYFEYKGSININY